MKEHGIATGGRVSVCLSSYQHASQRRLQCHSLCDIIAAFVWLIRQRRVGSATALELTSNVAASETRIYARTAANKR